MLLLVTCFWVFKDFLIGNKWLLYTDIGSDTLNQIYPFSQMIKRELTNGFPKWSFNQGLGQYVAPFNTGNIFQWFLYYFSDENVAGKLAVMEFLKFIMSGFVFGLFLKETKFSSFSVVIGGLAYGLSSYLAITVGWFSNLATLAFHFAFLLFALEIFLQRKIWYFLPLAVGFIALDQPFYLLLFAEFIVIYLFVWFSKKQDFSDCKTIICELLKIVGLSIYGILMGFVLFSGNLYIMLNSPRGSGLASYSELLTSKPVLETVDANQFSTIITRLFSNNLLGVGLEFKGWMNYMEAPAFFMGLFGLLLLPQLFILSSSKLKKVYGIVAGLVFVSLVFPYFRYLLWGFTGDYYRLYALYVGTAILLAGLRVIDDLQDGKKLNLVALLITVVFLVGLLLFNYSDDWNHKVLKSERTLVLFFMIVTSLILASTKVISNKYIWSILLVITVVELVHNAKQTLTKRAVVTKSETKNTTGYNDGSTEAIKYIQQRDSSFYRIEKDYSSSLAVHQSMNDPMIQNYRGTTVYTEFNHKNQVLFMSAMNLLDIKNEFETRWLNRIPTRQILMSNLSVKYVLSKGGGPLKNFGYDSLATIQNITIYQNPNALPFGVGYDSIYTSDFFDKLSPLQKDLGLFRGVVIDVRDKNKFSEFTEIKDSLGNITLEELKNLSAQRQKNVLKKTKASNEEFEGVYNADKTQCLYFSIPFDQSWQATIDGKKAETLVVNYGMTGLIVPRGKHKVILRYVPPFLTQSAFISVFELILYVLGIFFTVIKSHKNKNGVNS